VGIDPQVRPHWYPCPPRAIVDVGLEGVADVRGVIGRVENAWKWEQIAGVAGNAGLASFYRPPGTGDTGRAWYIKDVGPGGAIAGARWVVTKAAHPC
jgi:hypothetical protein